MQVELISLDALIFCACGAERPRLPAEARVGKARERGYEIAMGWFDEPPRTAEQARDRKIGALIFSIIASIVASALFAGFWEAVIGADAFWSSFVICFVIGMVGLYPYCLRVVYLTRDSELGEEESDETIRRPPTKISPTPQNRSSKRPN